ncbi:MAG: hypothetical protein EOQ42_10520 [Mesorhizobium sp.]|nr:MAG: hypothetical protein EOQ43_11065 [Mesorhizobium sp.]RWB75494.1 MAG: hypothetical protein EOQ42_10520 [Mesorhizobium sp.]RWD19796.1 MAG: hypothetical protein EOS57_11445 [Mesorhizobium sp.]TIU79674.1 MAG: hypothetical protein E5W13_06370 [Mesorhizobium sp.]
MQGMPRRRKPSGQFDFAILQNAELSLLSSLSQFRDGPRQRIGVWGLHLRYCAERCPARLAAIPGAPPSLSNLPKGCAFGPRCAFHHDACVVQPPLVGGNGHRAACALPETSRKRFHIREVASIETPV